MGLDSDSPGVGLMHADLSGLVQVTNLSEPVSRVTYLLVN